MSGKQYNTRFGGEEINTLGESGTGYKGKQAKILKGQGSQLNQPNYGQNRGKRKLIGVTVSLGLIDIAKAKGREDMENSFWQTYHCQETLIVNDGKSYGHYCRQRFCPLCSSNRKAQLINKYRPVIAKWPDPYFVTLTVLTCKAQGLRLRLDKVMRVFKAIVHRLKQRHKRGKGIKIMGVRSIECNYNPKEKTYNPHIHLIVPNKQVANLLMSTWLKEWGVWEATGDHQHKRPIKDLDRDLVETIKYGTKFITEPDPNDKKTKLPRHVYLRAMYNIIVAMRNMKQFRNFGFTLPKQTEGENKNAIVTVAYQEFEYCSEFKTWVDTETGNPLTNYVPDNELLELLHERMNLEAE